MWVLCIVQFPGTSKRLRSVFSAKAIVALENDFKIDPYPNQTRLRDLARYCGVTYKTARIWFQNKRQFTKQKEKKELAGLSKPCPMHRDSTASANTSANVNTGSTDHKKENSNIQTTSLLVEESLKPNATTTNQEKNKDRKETNIFAATPVEANKILDETSKYNKNEGTSTRPIEYPMSSEALVASSSTDVFASTPIVVGPHLLNATNTNKKKNKDRKEKNIFAASPVEANKILDKTSKYNKNEVTSAGPTEYPASLETLVASSSTDVFASTPNLVCPGLPSLNIDTNLNNPFLNPISGLAPSVHLPNNYPGYTGTPSGLYNGSVYPSPPNLDNVPSTYNPLHTLSDVALLQNALLNNPKYGTENGAAIADYYKQFFSNSPHLYYPNSFADAKYSAAQYSWDSIPRNSFDRSTYSSNANGLYEPNNTCLDPSSTSSLSVVSSNPTPSRNSTSTQNSNSSTNQSSFIPFKPWTDAASSNYKSDSTQLQVKLESNNKSLLNNSSLSMFSSNAEKRPKPNLKADVSIVKIKPNRKTPLKSKLNSSMTPLKSRNSAINATSNKQTSAKIDTVKVTPSGHKIGKSMPDLNSDELVNDGTVTSGSPVSKTLTFSNTAGKLAKKATKENLRPPNED